MISSFPLWIEHFTYCQVFTADSPITANYYQRYIICHLKSQNFCRCYLKSPFCFAGDRVVEVEWRICICKLGQYSFRWYKYTIQVLIASNFSCHLIDIDGLDTNMHLFYIPQCRGNVQNRNAHFCSELCTVGYGTAVVTRDCDILWLRFSVSDQKACQTAISFLFV